MKYTLIHSYNPIWVEWFNEIAQVIQLEIAIPSLIIEHVGSTSVSGLAAKPIIDIDVVYKTEEEKRKVFKGLKSLGYFHAGDQGIPGREVFKRSKDASHHLLDSINHHLYVCHEESNELKRHLAFRDFLRKNNRTCRDYELIKYQIAEKAGQDRKKYAELKEVEARSFIDQATSASRMK